MIRGRDKYAVTADKWDFSASNMAFEDYPKLDRLHRRMTNKHKTGAEIIRDLFHSFVKAAPTLVPKESMAASHKVNHLIMSEVMDMEEFKTLRRMSAGDSGGAAIATISLERDLDILFDKLRDVQEKAEKLDQMLDQIEAQTGEGTSDAAAEELISEAQRMQEEINQDLKRAEGMVESILQPGMEEAAQQAEAEMAASNWGLGKGHLTQMPLDERIALAQKLNTESFRRMSEVIGRMNSLTDAIKLERSNDSFEEIYDIELGNDLERVLLSELAFLSDEVLELDWMRKYSERGLSQYALRGTEKEGRGGIIYVEDGSASMDENRRTWAKGIGLALLKIAKDEKRRFTVIHFGGPKQYVTFDFDTSGEELKLTFLNKEYLGIEGLVTYAETNYAYSGTDFVSPLEKAHSMLAQEKEETGATNADIVMVTDGTAWVDDKWLETFHQGKREVGYHTFGILVNSAIDSTVSKICDMFITPANFFDGTDIAEMFKRVIHGDA